MKIYEDKKLYIYASEVKIDKVLYTHEHVNYYPYYISGKAEGIQFEVPSPLHGRSIIVDFNNKTNRFIITKGNGLTYFPFGFVTTKEMEDHAWGFLRTPDAIRDYMTGFFIEKLGLLTNKMEAVFTLETLEVKAMGEKYTVNPAILQYSVICPYRLSDIPYLSSTTINRYIKSWKNLSEQKEYHCIAADIFLKNLRVMWDNDVLHNAIHNQNYTLALEMLDFELSRSPETPYDNPKDEESYPVLRNREVIQSLEIVNYIAFQLNENLNIKRLNFLMVKYGFEQFLMS